MNILEYENYQEKISHGNPLFPYITYLCSIPLDFSYVPIHWHDEMEIIYIKKGHGIITVDFTQYQVSAGTLALIIPGQLHSIEQYENESMEYENIIFEVHFLGAGAADLCAGEFLVPLAAGKLLPPICVQEQEEGYDVLKQCLSQMEDLCASREKGYELGVKAAVLQLLFLLIRKHPSVKEVSSPDREQLKMVLHKIEKNIDENLTVGEMAKFCGWSDSHFMRWFKKMTGLSLIAYVNERRLAVAAEALKKTDDKILNISQDAGFTNLSNFNRQFRKRYGVTPKEYREMNDIS